MRRLIGIFNFLFLLIIGIIPGIRLLKKEDKTEYEKRAAESFKSSLIGSIFIAILIFVISSVGISKMYTFPNAGYTVRRVGTVENNMVRYVQGNLKYVSLEELNIDENKAEDKDSVNLYFDRDDNLIGGELESAAEGRAMNFVYYLLGSIGLAVFYIIISRLTFAKPFCIWVNEYNNEYNKELI